MCMTASQRALINFPTVAVLACTWALWQLPETHHTSRHLTTRNYHKYGYWGGPSVIHPGVPNVKQVPFNSAMNATDTKSKRTGKNNLIFKWKAFYFYNCAVSSKSF